ncbi:multidrug resistance protein [Spiribacter salinus M19-40]|jgi:multidrug efflux pump|uniref:Multidrug resistance protein n=2 Tax=Pseudomonadati TaxID=3379134 RepID=R4V9T5_9GAMM|nr:efflux RND transporter permease subunit [Spiribacter salinus]AGM41700.1 multidrug resistance protein [Spiribacter salinus M19-40]
MKFTDIFINRPVLATVVSLLILLAGVRSLDLLEVRQYPSTENTVVTVSTAFPGADSELVQGFITQPLQQAIAEAEGIDYITSESRQGESSIEVNMELNYDANAAVSEIQAKVASQRNVLPEDAQDPVIESSTGDQTALMYMAIYSEEVPVPEITDFVNRVVQPQVQALPGVAKARVFGRSPAMRIWLDPERMASLNVTAAEVQDVLRANNYQAGIGSTKGPYTQINLSVTTDVGDPDDFKRLVVREENGTIVRLDDIAVTDFASETYASAAWYKGDPSVFIAVEQAPGANPLDVAGAVKNELPALRSQLPEGIGLALPYDASQFIEDSINEVFKTIAEAVLIVLVVIFLTIGSVRAAIVPSLAVPLSLVGAATLMLALGYSLNLLTLLSLVLAIGLVVDDAIIVVENIHRHIEDGMSRVDAALTGARELAVPIIAMTTTLLAVYAPIGFMGGLVGTLFTEFAFTLAGAVLISGIVALTFSPMIASKVLKPAGNAGRFESFVERLFNGLAAGYKRSLHGLLETKSVPIFFGIIVLASNYFMFTMSENELAPTEDQSILLFQGSAPRTATFDYLAAFAEQYQDEAESIPEYNRTFMLLGGLSPDTVFGGFNMVPPSERERSQNEVQEELSAKFSANPGLDTAVFPRPSLPGSGGGLPVQFVMTTSESYESLDAMANEMIGQAMQSGNFIFLQKSVEYDRPMVTLNVDRDRAADLGISMADLGSSLSGMLGGGYVNRFNLDGRSYKVIPQVDRPFRLDADMLEDYYIETPAGERVPISSVVTMTESVEPGSRNQHQQLNSLTLEGVMTPGTPLGDALEYLETTAEDTLPSTYNVDYTGQSRQFAGQGSALVLTFFLSILVIYLVLAAQFESWRDPAIILVSVPLSIAGALAFITLGFATVNIYTQVGLITLIGVVAKNGILIVEFANNLQINQGLNKRDAVEEASAIRLRPIIMTSLALIMAMVPLLIATGPGAVSRFHIGLTIATGLGIGTIFTLFVLPAFYLLLARDHNASTPAGANA